MASQQVLHQIIADEANKALVWKDVSSFLLLGRRGVQPWTELDKINGKGHEQDIDASSTSDLSPSIPLHHRQLSILVNNRCAKNAD